MKQEIKNKDFREIGIDCGNPKGDKTVYCVPYDTPMILSKPKWYIRLFYKTHNITVNWNVYKALTKDGIVYFWASKKNKYKKTEFEEFLSKAPEVKFRYELIEGALTAIPDEDALKIIEIRGIK